MKTTIVLTGDTKQLVFKPETKFDEEAVKLLEGVKQAKVYRGEYYKCQGGWMREAQHDDQIDDLIVVFEDKKKDANTLVDQIYKYESKALKELRTQVCKELDDILNADKPRKGQIAYYETHIQDMIARHKTDPLIP